MERNLLCSIVSNIPLPKGVQISEDALYYDTHTHTHTHTQTRAAATAMMTRRTQTGLLLMRTMRM